MGPKKATTSRVFIHSVEYDDAGFAQVFADHKDYPRLRFMAVLHVADGALVAFHAFDRRLAPTPPELPTSDPGWGPLVNVTRRLLAELPFGEIERAVRARVAEDFADIVSGDIEMDDEAKWLVELAAMEREPRRTGRPRLSDHFLAEVAHDYAGHLTKEGHPIAALARARDYSPNTVKGWVQEARQRGLLTSAPGTDGPVGKAGGRLTKKARTILREGGKHG